MQSINTRGTFVVSRACIPHLKAAENPHILTLSPPISLEPRWLGGHIGYTLSKYGMSLLALGLAEELREDGIASNALWPRTLIATAAVQNLLGGDAAMAVSRKPELYADAAYAVLTKPSRECTGNTFLCEDVLQRRGRHRLRPVRLRPRLDAAGRPVRRPRLDRLVSVLTHRVGAHLILRSAVGAALKTKRTVRTAAELAESLLERRHPAVARRLTPRERTRRVRRGGPVHRRRGR